MCVFGGWGGDSDKKQLPFNTIINFKNLSSAVILWKSKSAYGAVWLRGYETFFMLNSAEHEISTTHKN